MDRATPDVDRKMIPGGRSSRPLATATPPTPRRRVALEVSARHLPRQPADRAVVRPKNAASHVGDTPRRVPPAPSSSVARRRRSDRDARSFAAAIERRAAPQTRCETEPSRGRSGSPAVDHGARDGCSSVASGSAAAHEARSEVSAHGVRLQRGPAFVRSERRQRPSLVAEQAVEDAAVQVLAGAFNKRRKSCRTPAGPIASRRTRELRRTALRAAEVLSL